MYESAKQYLVGVLQWWWFLVISILGGGLGVATTVLGGDFTVPIWVWVPIMVLGLFLAQFLAFHKVREERDGLRARAQQSTPSYSFFIEKLDSKFVEPSLLLIQIGITVTPTMLVEDIQLRLLDKSIPSDWKPQRIGGSPERQYVYFVIPDWVKSGEYSVRLVGIAEGKTAESKPFRVSFP